MLFCFILFPYTQFIGPVMTQQEAADSGLPYKADGKYFRRVVPSPLPLKMLDAEMQALRLLTDAGCVVICAGGGGIPVMQNATTGELQGVEAVIDKDRAATMVGDALEADGLIILTDVTAVAINFGQPAQRWIKCASPAAMEKLLPQFPDGSMGPKCASAIDFCRRTGAWAAIGSLTQAEGILVGTHGTRIESRAADDNDDEFVEFYEDHLDVPDNKDDLSPREVA